MKGVVSIVMAMVLALTVPAVGGCGKAPSPADGVRVSFIDVGKGDCILIQAGESAVLIDAGYDATAASVVSHLQQCGVSRLDSLIITHYDKDHIDGVRRIGGAVSIGAVYLPGYVGSDKNYSNLMGAVERLGLDARQVTEELCLTLGDAALTLYPSSVAYVPAMGGEEGNDNDVSLVATLVNGNDSYLFTGDLEKEGIDAYLERGRGHFDVLKMPHHGRKSSRTDELLDDVSPKIAVITDSAQDPADKKTLKLLEESGTDVYRTSTDGTITVQGDGSGRYSVDCE